MCWVLIGNWAVADTSEELSLVQKRAGVMHSEDETDEMSDEPVVMLSSDTASSAELNWRTITCPVVGAMFRTGDLLPDQSGIINKQQVINAFLRVGISQDVTTSTSNGNFDHLPEPKEINIFNMDLQMAANNQEDEKLRNKEHDFSTGVRDGKKPNAKAYAVFEQFIDTDGDGTTWSQADIAAAIEYYKKNSNDLGVGMGGIGSLSVMLKEFANSDGTLSKEEMKELFMRSVYPKEFRARRKVTMAGWEKTQRR